MSDKCVVDLILRGTLYKVECTEGKSTDLLQLAKKLDDSIHDIALNTYHGSEAALFLVAALKLEDQIAELEHQNNVLKKQIEENTIMLKEKERLEQFMDDSKIYIVSRMEKISKYIEDKINTSN